MLAELDAAGIDQAIVGGVSMGGYVALALLRRHPDRVAGLVLADTRSGADDDAALDRRRARGGAGRPRGHRRRPGRDRPVGRRRRPPTESGRTLAAIAGAVPAADHRLGAAGDGRPGRIRPELLAAASVPVLVVVGEQDAVTPPAVARQMAAAAPEAELVELPGVGHLTPGGGPGRVRRRRDRLAGSRRF